MDLIKGINEDFYQMKELMRAAKWLGCEPFYQLMAASIGSWFRKRNIRDVNVELALDKN